MRWPAAGRPREAALIVGAVGAAALAAWWYARSRRRPARRRWSHGVEVRPSRIRGAGDGLFASRDFAAGEALGEYYGLVLTLLQAHNLEDRDYLMGGFGINAHVDAKFALDAPARYVNDHFDASRLNAHFVKDRQRRRAALIASRPIRRGEEVYASYGESYWRARGIDPATGKRVEGSGPGG